jgi:hypothetical protein
LGLAKEKQRDEQIVPSQDRLSWADKIKAYAGADELWFE